jgi:hypothetical protein
MVGSLETGMTVHFPLFWGLLGRESCSEGLETTLDCNSESWVAGLPTFTCSTCLQLHVPASGVILRQFFITRRCGTPPTTSPQYSNGDLRNAMNISPYVPPRIDAMEMHFLRTIRTIEPMVSNRPEDSSIPLAPTVTDVRGPCRSKRYLSRLGHALCLAGRRPIANLPKSSDSRRLGGLQASRGPPKH